MSGRLRPGALVASLVAVLAVGVSVGVLVAWEPEPPLPDAADYDAEAVAIGVGAYDGAFIGTATVTWSEPVDVVAPRGLTGVVTASACPAGGVLRSGDRLLDVDGIGRIAFHSNPPFHRPLQLGDVGADVTALRRLVGGRGASTTFDPGLATAVAAYDRSVGVPDSNVFDPTTVVYLPADEVAVGTCAVAVGQVVDAGAVLLSSGAAPASLVVAPGAGPGPVDGPWEVTMNGVTVPIERAEDGSFVTHDPAGLATLGLRPDAAGLPADVHLVTPIESATVPASALLAGGTATCLAVGTPDHFDVREVVVLDARLGVVQVTNPPGTDPLRGTVVTNAPLVAADRPCPDR